MTTKTLNRERTIQNIMEVALNSNDMNIDVQKFNKRMTEAGSNEFLRESAELLQAKIVYDEWQINLN
jgi:hypothetical protein